MFLRRGPGHLRIGKRGENLAAWYLRLSGYRIVERNFRSPLGEIDIIARKRDMLIFVEVKTRSTTSPYHPLEAVGAVQVYRTVQAARMYLMGFRPPFPACRFDIIGITPGISFSPRRFRHIKNAFDITSDALIEGRRREMGIKSRRFEKSGRWRIEKGKWSFRRKG
jgi:putative endonuclease